MMKEIRKSKRNIIRIKMTDKEKIFKVVLLGDSGVGKTSIYTRYKKKIFNKNVESTMGACFHQQEICVNNMVRKIQIWDTAGQERYKSLLPMYYRNADCILLVYDVSIKKNGTNIEKWLDYVKQTHIDNPIIILVANKIDKVDIDYYNDNNYIKNLINIYKCVYIETSALTNHNIDKLFEIVVEKLYNTIFDISEETETVIVNYVNTKQYYCCTGILQ